MTGIVDIGADDARRFSRDTVKLKHRFADTGMFTDDALAALIEAYPRQHLSVNTVTPLEDGTLWWRHGSVEGRSGAEVLEAVRHGRLWIHLQHLQVGAPDYQALVQSAFDGIREHAPGFKTFKHNSGLLISSPQARVLYHCDIPPIALWHIRGRKRLYLYPDTDEFLANEDRERVVLRETEEEIPYLPAFDAKAQVFDLEPGDALGWKMQAPHRVDNLDGLNVSITTEFFTPETMRFYAVAYANGAMRRLFNRPARSYAVTGPFAWAKFAFAAAVRASGILKARERIIETSFEVDPDEDLGFADLAPPQAPRGA